MRLMIDGQDTMTAFNAYVVDGGLRGLMAWPALKQPQKNEWHEEDGQDVDLSNPVLDARNFSIQMASPDAYAAIAAIRTRMSQSAYHSITVYGSQRYTVARFVSASNVNALNNLATFSLNFCADDPFQYEYMTPASTLQADNSYKINNPANTGMIPLTRYGVRILKGTAQSFLFIPEARTGAAIVDTAYADGAEYDDAPTTYRSPEVTLRCLMHERSVSALNRNYDALLHDLVRPGARQLYTSVTGRTYSCHYVSQEVTEYDPDLYWLKFNIKLRILDNIR